MRPAAMPGLAEIALSTALLTIVSADGHVELQNPTFRDAEANDEMLRIRTKLETV